MAGASMSDGSDENPIPLNVTPLVDIIFCLCLFFLCSFHFKQLEGKMDSWLPKDKGIHGTPVQHVELEDIKIWMKWDSSSNTVTRKVNQSEAANDSDLQALLAQRRTNFETAGKAKNEIPVSIDAAPDVPWKDIIKAMNICKREGLEKIEFAAPWPDAAAATAGS
ncbi:MAG: biopolymer transporter ExbD [Planctomycetes bacterium]|nr:biopolymer transporter ExbD [Planctomycetota bacterium]